MRAFAFVALSLFPSGSSRDPAAAAATSSAGTAQPPLFPMAATFAGSRFGRATASAVSRRGRRSLGAGDDCSGSRRGRLCTATAAPRRTDSSGGTLFSSGVSTGGCGRIVAVGRPRPAGYQHRRLSSGGGGGGGGGLAAATAAGSCFVSQGTRGRRRQQRPAFCQSSMSMSMAMAMAPSLAGRVAAVPAPALLSSRARSTCCFSSVTNDEVSADEGDSEFGVGSADKGGSATTADGSRSSRSGNGSDSGGDNSDGDGEWPAPYPGQLYVARARCGRRYEHPEGATRIRAVVSDLDGTLLGPDKAVSATTLEAVRKARAKGVIFIPASGRSKAGMFSSMGELGEDLKRDSAPLICMNGLTVYGQGDGDDDHGEIIYSELMCPHLARKVVAFWKEHPLAEAAGVSLCGSEGETIVVERLDARTRSFTDWKEPLPKEVGDWEDAILGGMELNRLYFWGPSRAAVDAFLEDLKEHLKDNPAELTRGVPEMIEVLPQGASKAVGLEALLKKLGIAPHEVIALGDEENDVEMLRSVVGVAMGQSSREVRCSAQFTAPSNAHHGVAVALETFCGI